MLPTTTGSSSSWKEELADEFCGKYVIILPDADEAGKRYADKIAKSLAKRGVTHKLVSFTDTLAKDVTDYLRDYSVSELLEHIGENWTLGENDADEEVRTVEQVKLTSEFGLRNP